MSQKLLIKRGGFVNLFCRSRKRKEHGIRDDSLKKKDSYDSQPVGIILCNE